MEDPAGVVDVGVVSVGQPLARERLCHLPRDELGARGEDVGHPGGGEAGEATEGEDEGGGEGRGGGGGGAHGGLCGRAVAWAETKEGRWRAA